MKPNALTTLLLLWLDVSVAVAAAPQIVSEPDNQTNVIGSTVRFDAAAVGDPPLQLQWRSYLGNLFTNIPGATSSVLTLTNIQPTTRRFAMVAANSAGSVTSRLAALTVLRPPSFSIDPASTIAVEGSDLLLGLTAVGTAPIRYQWFLDGQAIAGRTGQSLAVARASRTNEGDYSAVATNPYGSATSRVARVRITPAPSALQARVLPGDARVPLPYRLFTPSDPPSQGAGPYPLVLALHGAGERGSDNIAQLSAWPQPMVFISYTNQVRFPLVFVAPQCPADRDWLETDIRGQLFALIDALISAFPVDTNRIYVTGLSMGGFCSWELPRLRSSYFAAAVPIAGGGTPSRAVDLKDLPIWNFHSAMDNIVPVDLSRQMIHAVRAVGGRPVYTEYAQGGHAIWAQAWATPGLVEWTLSQRRTLPSQIPPDLQITNIVNSRELRPTSATNVSLAGVARVFGEPLTKLTWTNLLSRRGGTGIGTANWAVESLPLVMTGTNTVVVVGSTYSFAPGLGGTTTVNDFVRWVYQPPLRLTAVTMLGNQVRIEWTGSVGPFLLQSTPSIDVPTWTDVVSAATSPLEIRTEGPRAFFRIVSNLEAGDGESPQ